MEKNGKMCKRRRKPEENGARLERRAAVNILDLITEHFYIEIEHRLTLTMETAIDKTYFVYGTNTLEKTVNSKLTDFFVLCPRGMAATMDYLVKSGLFCSKTLNISFRKFCLLQAQQHSE